MSKNSNLNPYEELANAIVLQAVRDYREAVKNCPEEERTVMHRIPKMNVFGSFGVMVLPAD